MSWNLFEKILNAFSPKNNSEQPSEQSQQWPESNTEQPWQEGSPESSQSSQESSTEGSTEQPEASQEPSPAFQQAPSSPQQDDWKQPESNSDWQQE